MKLWTYHPITFRPDDPNGTIDHTRGMYWGKQRYRETLLRLRELLGTDQFLWCWTTRGSRSSMEILLHEWELDVPLCEILAFYSVPIWEDIFNDRGEAWDCLLVENAEAVADENLAAWVRFPLRECSIRCVGRPSDDRMM
jgi:hypothetical protein